MQSCVPRGKRNVVSQHVWAVLRVARETNPMESVSFQLTTGCVENKDQLRKASGMLVVCIEGAKHLHLFPRRLGNSSALISQVEKPRHAAIKRDLL